MYQVWNGRRRMLKRVPRLTKRLPSGHRSLWQLIAEVAPWAIFQKRQWRWFFITVSTVLVVGGGVAAHAEETNDGKGASTVTGFGDLFGVPDLAGAGSKTLFETYGPTVWTIDTELDFKDVLQNAGNGLVVILFFLLVSVMYAVIAIVYWLLSVSSIPALQESMAGIVGGTASGMMEWLFPSALVIGGVVAFALRHRDGQGAALGQWTWVVIMGVFAVSLSMTPDIWTNGAGSVRQLGAETIVNATADGLATNDTYPMSVPAVDYGADKSVNALRKTGDGIWRGFVATPWCIVNFGSVEACERYGIAMLNKGNDNEARKTVIKDFIYVSEGDGNRGDGKDSETGQWVKGESWPARLGMVLMCLVAVLIFAVVTLILALGASGAVIMMFLLLAVGAFFVTLWVIPGKPRAWGVAWFEALIGALVSSLLQLLAFSALITVITGLLGSITTLGWGFTIILVCLASVMTFSVKKTLERITGTGGTGGGNALLGYMAMRAGGKAIKSGARVTSRLARGVAGGVSRTAGSAAKGLSGRRSRSADVAKPRTQPRRNPSYRPLSPSNSRGGQRPDSRRPTPNTGSVRDNPGRNGRAPVFVPPERRNNQRPAGRPRVSSPTRRTDAPPIPSPQRQNNRSAEAARKPWTNQSRTYSEPRPSKRVQFK